MSSLAGLVNYSDDESSSSSDELVVETVNVVKETTPKPPKVEPPLIKKEPEPSLSTKKEEPIIKKEIVPLEQPTIPSIIKSGPVYEYNKRLMAALAPKPIEGVDNWGIPEEPETSCDPERAERIAHFLSLRASGHRLNEHLQKNKAFRNPRIYTKLVEFTEVDELGSNFDPSEFDPHGFPSSLYLENIESRNKKREEERLIKQQTRTTVDFVPPQIPSAAMAQAMAQAAKVASRIVKPPVVDPIKKDEKRKSKWEDNQLYKKSR